MCLVKKHRCPCLGTMQHSHHFLKGSSWTAIIYLPRRLKQQFLIFFSNISTSQESGKNNSMSGCYEWRYDISVSFTWNQTARGNKLLCTWHCWERGLAVANCFSPEQGHRGAFPPSSVLNRLSAAFTWINCGRNRNQGQQSILIHICLEVGK